MSHSTRANQLTMMVTEGESDTETEKGRVREREREEREKERNPGRFQVSDRTTAIPVRLHLNDDDIGREQYDDCTLRLSNMAN